MACERQDMGDDSHFKGILGYVNHLTLVQVYSDGETARGRGACGVLKCLWPAGSGTGTSSPVPPHQELPQRGGRGHRLETDLVKEEMKQRRVRGKQETRDARLKTFLGSRTFS